MPSQSEATTIEFQFCSTSQQRTEYFLNMKTSRSRSKNSATIGNPRWLAYAAAGAATALGGATSAEGEIHYSGLIKYQFEGLHSQDRTFRWNRMSGLFFNREINYTGSHTWSYNGADEFFEIGAQNGSVAGFFYTCAYDPDVASVSNLDFGDAISQRPFVPSGGILMTADGLGCGGAARGQFFSEGVDFIGFKFDRGRGVQYGWARIKKGPYPQNRYELVDYAYADPGEPISAGQKSSNQMVPEAGSLGGLALGAAGLQAWRKRRSRAAR